MTSGHAGLGAVTCGERGAPEIDYWQGDLQLVAFGMREVSWSLPQDAATAAVILGALLARNVADDVWPGVYRAVVRDAAGCAVVTEDDLRVAAVRELLRGCREVWSGKLVRRGFTADELTQARALALSVGPEPGPGAPSESDEGGATTTA